MTPETENQMLPPEVDTALKEVGLLRLGDVWPADTEEKLEERRRAFYKREQSSYAQLNLVRGYDGVLRWHEGAARARTFDRRRRAGRAALPTGTVEKQYIYERLHEPNQVAAAVKKLDDVLTNPAKRDLYRLNADHRLDTAVRPDVAGQFAGKKILLFVHGTFSHCDQICDQIRDAKAGRNDPFGRKFLADARAHYDLVLGYNHPTLAVSPMVNAFSLAALLRDSQGPAKSVDVVCHSRGGLVTRWWLEGFADPRTKYRAMFVASPLGGTSLAAPARIKSGMDLLSNLSSALSKGAALTAVPLIQVAGGVLKVIGSVTKLVAKTPAIDAAVAAIPGLAGQSRAGTNFEIENLAAAGGWQSRADSYFAIRSDFVPPPEDKWKFWRVFCSPRDLLLGWADKAVDDLVFAGRPRPDAPLEAVPNDLVVDCPSMSELADRGRIDKVYDFGRSSTVYHTNYFEQRETLDFIRKSFRIPEA